MSSNQRKFQPSWIIAAILTAVIGGVVQIIVNHFDGIVSGFITFFGGEVSQFHVSAPVKNILDLLSGVALFFGLLFVYVLVGLVYSARQAVKKTRVQAGQQEVPEIERGSREQIGIRIPNDIELPNDIEFRPEASIQEEWQTLRSPKASKKQKRKAVNRLTRKDKD